MIDDSAMAMSPIAEISDLPSFSDSLEKQRQQSQQPRTEEQNSVPAPLPAPSQHVVNEAGRGGDGNDDDDEMDEELIAVWSMNTTSQESRQRGGGGKKNSASQKGSFVLSFFLFWPALALNDVVSAAASAPSSARGHVRSSSAGRPRLSMQQSPDVVFLCP